MELQQCRLLRRNVGLLEMFSGRVDSGHAGLVCRIANDGSGNRAGPTIIWGYRQRMVVPPYSKTGLDVGLRLAHPRGMASIDGLPARPFEGPPVVRHLCDYVFLAQLPGCSLIRSWVGVLNSETGSVSRQRFNGQPILDRSIGDGRKSALFSVGSLLWSCDIASRSPSSDSFDTIDRRGRLLTSSRIHSTSENWRSIALPGATTTHFSMRIARWVGW